MATILVVDDEMGIRALLSEILADEGHTVELAENAAQARSARERSRPDLVLLDIWMPDVDGITLLKEWGASGLLTMPVVMMSGHGTIDTAVEATKFGAFGFLEKPITLQKLLRTVDGALVKPAPAPAKPGAGQPALAGGAGAFGNPMTSGWSAGTPGVAPPASFPPAHRSDAETGAYGQPSHDAPHTTAHSAAGPHEPSLHAEQSFDLDRPLREARDAFEKSYFEFHLAREGGSMTRVAEKTGLERTHLYRKLKQLGVDLTKAKRHPLA
jgi:DNA-binding NtrC family response regulator